MKFILSVLVLVLLVSVSTPQDYSALGGLPSKKYDALNGEHKEAKPVTPASYCPPAG